MAAEEETGGITASDLETGTEPETKTPAPAATETLEELDPTLFQDFDLGEEPAAKEGEQKPATDVQDQELPADAPAIAKQLKEKYPTIFKDIPGLRKALFAGPQVLEVFPTPEEARVAYKRLEAMDHLVSRVVDHGDVGMLLDHIYNAEPGSIKSISDNFLPTLFQKSPELFKSAIRPVFSSMIRDMIQNAEQSQNKTLYITAKNLSQYIFGTAEPPTEDKPVASNAPDPEKERLVEANKELNQTLQRNFMAYVGSKTTSMLEAEIANRLDPKNVIPAALRKLVIKQAVEDIRTVIRGDQNHVNRMVLLNQRASKDNYSDSHKQSLVEAYMSSARAVLPSVVQKIRAELVAKQGNGKQQQVTKQQTAVDRSRAPNGQFTQEIPTDPHKVDWSKHRDTKDFLFAEKVAVK